MNCVYPMEFISKRWRTLCGSLGFWPVGQMLLALLVCVSKYYFLIDQHTNARAWIVLKIKNNSLSITRSRQSLRRTELIDHNLCENHNSNLAV